MELEITVAVKARIAGEVWVWLAHHFGDQAQEDGVKSEISLIPVEQVQRQNLGLIYFRANLIVNQPTFDEINLSKELNDFVHQKEPSLDVEVTSVRSQAAAALAKAS